MTATTATQGFIYSTGTDAPCTVPTTLAALAGQLDTKLTGYATDLARIRHPPAVVLSATSSASRTAGTFDTVVFNYNTPTDLGTYNRGVLLNAGFYAVWGSMGFDDPATNKYFYMQGPMSGAVSVVLGGSPFYTLGYGTFAGTAGIFLSSCSILKVAVDASPVGAFSYGNSFTPAASPISFYMAALKMADLF